MQKRLRRKALALVKEAFEKRSTFKKVSMSAPDGANISSGSMPAIHISAAISRVTEETWYQGQTDYRFSVLGIINAQNDTELVKADLTDDIEETLHDLFRSADWANAEGLHQLRVDNIDPSPVSLFPYGINMLVAPPLGVVRFDCFVDINYDQT